MAQSQPTFETLLVDPKELGAFLYSCAYVRVLASDTLLISESTGMLWGLGNALGMAGGSAQRVTERLTPNQRRAAALQVYNNMLADYRGLLSNPAAQLRFLTSMQAQRDRRWGEIRAKFDAAEAHNAAADAALTSAARTWNNVQAVCTVALCCLAPVAGVARAGATFVIVLGTKSVIAFAQSEHSMASLKAFALWSAQSGAVTLGEISNKAFELVKDGSIDGARTALGRATANYTKELGVMREEVLRLRAQMEATQRQMLAERPGSGIRQAMQRSISQNAAEIQEIEARMATVGKGAVDASRGGQRLLGFGTKVVPLVCCAIDVVSEYQRWWEANDQIEYGAAGGRRAPSHR
ncbi:MAG: hypothetical protein IPK81_22320 [Rhodospirillales bacterium]|nr:MAG: hypothetical protein IPK81_22320 [Rhodospirillales bacterium]